MTTPRAAPPTALHERTAVDLAADVRNGRVSAVDVLESYLARVAAVNAPLNAIVFLDPARARARARSIDEQVAAGDDPGPLAGVPLAVKELEAVEGWPETHASTAFADNVATTTVTQIRRLLAAGAVPFGLTASPEMGLLNFTASALHGITRNPWNTERTPGGSSGGSAAAVAAAMAPIATGSDMGGSIRLPASYCGVVGVKGTYGLVPRGPAYLTAVNLTHAGPLASTVRDAARYLDCVVGPDDRDPYSLPAPGVPFERAIDELDLAGARVAFLSDNGLTGTEPAVSAVCREAADALVAAADLDQVDVALTLPAVEDNGAGLLVADADPDPAMQAAQVEVFTNLLERTPGARPLIEILATQMAAPSLESVVAANQTRHAVREALADLFERVDLLLAPTSPVPPFGAAGPLPMEVDGRELGPSAASLWCFPFNLAGLPAVNVPAGFVDGLPVGLQIVARRCDDARALAAAAAFERARPWPRHAPDP